VSLSPLSTPVSRRQRRWPGRLLAIVALIVVVVVVLVAVGSWIGSSILLDPHHDLVKEDVDVKGFVPGKVTLEATKASKRPGVYGLDDKNGHAIAGPILAQGGNTVTRRVREVRGSLNVGSKVAIDPDVYEGNPQQALGVKFRSVAYPDPLGRMPAWFIPGRAKTWVVFVHGIDGTRQGGLRVVPALRRAGVPILLIDYRNDQGAPKSSDGLIHLGQTEWQDLDAAVSYARRRGAEHLILYGDSMGGAIVTKFMRSSPQGRFVNALVLDAPALDWESIIDNQADRYDLPFMGPPVRWVIGERIDFDWSGMNEVEHAADFKLPILLYQGLDDPLVPPKDSATFAQRAPRVQYVTTPQAGHIQSWNVNPARYNGILTPFVRSHR
jgi:uncharacterized protein